MGLVTKIYCLRFETSLLVAPYDSQGCGGGIRSRLLYECSAFIAPGRTDERTESPTVRVSICFIHCHGNVLTKPLSGNLLLCKRALIPWRPALESHCLAMVYSGFQTSRHNIIHTSTVHCFQVMY
jgi:hypothetical protein